MPRSKRYGRIEGLPRTLRRSGQDAQATYTRAHEDAVRAHGEGDRADRCAFAVLKRKFEKRGDHWIAKDDPAD